jgi:hypothetical protein
MPSKRRRNRDTKPPAPTQRQAAAASRAGSARLWIIGGVVMLVLVGALAVVAIQRGAGAAAQPTAGPLGLPGPVNDCRKVPRFATAAGYELASFATDDRAVMGLKMFDPNSPERIYRHESWDDAGYLGPLSADGQGNVYVAPVPRISLVDNPPEIQNRVYKVDSNTGVMSLFVEMPAATPPSPENPYGVMGMAIDCETNSLYVTSIAGSTRDAEHGRIYRVDLASGAAIPVLENIDAIGVAPFNTARGKRLYYGLARASEIRSVALDAAGNAVGSDRSELMLDAPGASGADRARRLTFTEASELVVNGRQFDYNLVANTYQPLLRYTYRYRLSDDGWDFVRFEPN